MGVRGIKRERILPPYHSVIAHQKRLVCGLKTYRPTALKTYEHH
ncbi:hypothetical protein HPHPA5_0284 [Helicobacter pylori Hp A-5]|nr:hypothetical protein HPHPA5_0284 [Helicobacter pylori Hp A-5]